jgi:short subunit dehydrogenase-like uncharacterized protein
MADPFLIYGANGYTGELVAREAARRGLRPVLGGRNQAQVTALAAELGLECRVFDLSQPAAVDAGLAGMTAVTNCAGPFVRTAWPVIDACLRTRVHYIDITGELGQFERCAGRDGEAQEAGVMLLPGAGFDVVPSDCLAVHLKERLPAANRLTLGIQTAGGISRGTATTAIENAQQGAFVRVDGRITCIPAGSRTRSIDFGRGPVEAIVLPWGDVATAYYSTGISNIEVYFAFPDALRTGIRLSRYLTPLLKIGAVQNLLIGRIRAGRPGPSAAQRAGGYALLWGQVKDSAGRTATARLRTPESYDLTAMSTLLILEKILAGQARPGYQTPAKAYGSGLVLELPGVVLTDETAPSTP